MQTSYSWPLSDPVIRLIAQKNQSRLQNLPPLDNDSTRQYLDYGLASLGYEAQAQEKQVNALTVHLSEKVDEHDKNTILALQSIEKRFSDADKRLSGIERQLDELGTISRIRSSNATKLRLHQTIEPLPRIAVNGTFEVPANLPDSVKGFLRLGQFDRAQTVTLISLLRFYGINSVRVPVKAVSEWKIDNEEEEVKDMSIDECMDNMDRRSACVERLATELGLDYPAMCENAERLRESQGQSMPRIVLRRRHDDDETSVQYSGEQSKKVRTALSPGTSVTSPSRNSGSPYRPRGDPPSSSSTSRVPNSPDYEATQRLSSDSET